MSGREFAIRGITNGQILVTPLASKIYAREPRFPTAVPQLILKLAIENSHENPSVGNLKEWTNPWNGETITIGRHLTMNSERELAFKFLILYKDKFELAVKWPELFELKNPVISRSKYEEDLKIPFKTYVEHVFSR